MAVRKLLYSICLLIDYVAYWLMKQLYLLFIRLSTTTIFDTETINAFLNRAWVFVGILVLLKLSISLITMITSPDDFSDSKKGFGNLVMRIMVSLCLFAFCRTGFTYMYKLQYILTNNHIIEKTIFGYDVFGDGTSNDTVANSIVVSIYNGFFDYSKEPADKQDTISGLILDYKFTDLASYAADDVSNYIFIISFIAGFYVDYILIIFCFDVAVRSIKLGLYEMLAPVPIIMYIDPQKGDDVLKNWLTKVGATFADLFIRIGIIDFAIYIIALLKNNGGISTICSDGTLIQAGGKCADQTAAVVPDFFLLSFIAVGLFMFAKEAPNLLKDLTGIDLSKSGGPGMFDLNAKMKGVPVLGTAAAVAESAKADNIKTRVQTLNNFKKHPIQTAGEKVKETLPYRAGAAIAGGVGKGINSFRNRGRVKNVATAQKEAMAENKRRNLVAGRSENNAQTRAAAEAENAQFDYNRDVKNGTVNPANGQRRIEDVDTARTMAENEDKVLTASNAARASYDTEVQNMLDTASSDEVAATKKYITDLNAPGNQKDGTHSAGQAREVEYDKAKLDVATATKQSAQDIKDNHGAI